jgi:putative heme-binding domain-containing protein
VRALADNSRDAPEREAIIRTLSQLRSHPKPFTGEPSEPGVETVLGQLLTVAKDDEAPASIRGDALRLVGQIDSALAKPVALELLGAKEVALAAAAIDVLAADRNQAIEVGEAFVAEKVDRRLLPQVAAALRRHLTSANDQPIQELLAGVFRGGLLVSLDPADIARVEDLVAMQGDPIRGREVFLSPQSQCAKCHKLEGAGGQVGPDLTKIWDTHAIAKIMESMIDPSKEIKEGYATWTVSTARGQVFTGLKMKDDAAEVVLRDAEGKDIRIPANDVDEKFENPLSLMPDGVISQLSYEQFIDLVAFLKNREAQASLAGMLRETNVIGPFPTDNAAYAELAKAAAALQPVTFRRQELAWKPLTAGADGTFDLRQTHPFENASVFATAEFESPRAQAVTFDVWFDDEIEVWFNGQVVHTSSNVHTMESVEAQAKAGRNELLIKVINGGTDFAFRFFVRGEGVRFEQPENGERQ